MNLPDIEAKRVEVAQFLSQFKLASAGQRPVVSKRPKNLQAFIDLGLTLNEQERIIFSLTPEDYVSGPESDRDRPGFVWVFGTKIAATEIYIKLKIVEYTPIDTGVPVRKAHCLSFHPADRPMNYPLK